MNAEQKKRLSDLKKKNRKHIEQLVCNRNVLLQECLDALGDYQIICDELDIARIVEIANSARTIHIEHSEMPPLWGERIYYIVWDELSLPIIECKGNAILAHWDDVMAVAFDTCFVDKDNQRTVLIR